MKILELCGFSCGICGVFARVKEESLRLAQKGHEVKIFSSNVEKGGGKIVGAYDSVEGVEIRRFPAVKWGGESYMRWNFEADAVAFKPDVIIAHSYRHPHTTKALKLGKKIGAKVFLVTHAPFDRNDTRSFLARLVVSLYDSVIGPNALSQFTKVFRITNWEVPYLKKLGVSEDRMVYVPNGVPELFFDMPLKKKEKHTILFLGRVAPIKQLETIIEALTMIDDTRIIFEIVGPAEEAYLKRLQSLAARHAIAERVVFSPPLYDLKEKIAKIDSAMLFVLPSKSEGMSQALVEAMARGKVVLAANNKSASDIIQHGKNGYLYKNGDAHDAAQKITVILDKPQATIKKNARASVKQFNWNVVIKTILAQISAR